MATTKILFIESDESSFFFRKCMAEALFSLPPVELIHASDAEEALSKIENNKVDVLIIDDELEDELEVLLDSLGATTPPILLQTDRDSTASARRVTCIPKEESVASMHKTLVMATEAGSQFQKDTEQNTVH